MADLTGMMQAAAGNAGGGDNLFIEDVFSCFLYTGNGSTQTITNGIDLNGEGGMVWIKGRSGATDHAFYDTARGATFDIASNTNAAQTTQATGLTSFGSTGFSIGALAKLNTSAATYCSWTFRKAPKFFDVVTYTGNAASRAISHSLGQTPGMMVIKCTSEANTWVVWHRSLATPQSNYLELNTTAAVTTGNTFIWDNQSPTSDQFFVGASGFTNNTGETYVAYLFAHDDGGFGDDGTENAITCGSFTTDGSGNASVNLGYEPQWMITKASSQTEAWYINDVMRGYNAPSQGAVSGLAANASSAEAGTRAQFINSTGFTVVGGLSASQTYIFIAIRRGPMKTPTAGTEVYNGITRTGTSTNVTVTGVGFAPDLVIAKYRAGAGYPSIWGDRLRGVPRLLSSAANAAETSDGVDQITGFDAMDGIRLGNNQTTFQSYFNESGFGYINYFFRRSPGAFDVVCYTGTGSARTVAHNLGVVPELMIIKRRSAADNWAVYAGDNTDFLFLNTTAATADDNNYWNDTSPTSTVFSVGTIEYVNFSAATYVAYLFASLAGVQDIGTYTGNGTSLTVTTGFQPRFIMVKRTDSTGNWIVGDSARGLVAGNDPFLLLNSTNAEVTNQDWVDVSATGFTVNETAANANVSTGVYFYWAIS